MRKLSFLIILILIGGTLPGQTKYEACKGRRVNAYTKVEAPSIFTDRQILNKTIANRFNIKESETYPLPVDVRSVLDHATSIWSALIETNQPINIYVEWTTFTDSDALARCGPASFYNNFFGSINNYQYPIALAEKITNSNLNDDENEIELFINSSLSITWYTGLDGIPHENMFDLLCVLLHEIGHGLGFSPSFWINGDGLGTFGYYDYLNNTSATYPTIYDKFITYGTSYSNPNLVIKAANPSINIKTALTSNNLYFCGDMTYSLYSSMPKIYAPSEFDLGSSIAHLDDDTYPPGNTNSLMSASIDLAEVIHSPGEIGLTVLENLGWTVSRLITFEKPAPDEDLARGTLYNLKWTDNKGGYLEINLYKIIGDQLHFVQRILQTADYTKGLSNYDWTIPSDLQEGQYRIKMEHGDIALALSPIFNVVAQPKVETPVITPVSGTYPSPLLVTIECATDGATIRYTDHGGDPTSTSQVYSEPFYITLPKTIKARAFKSGYSDSDVATSQYENDNTAITTWLVDKDGNPWPTAIRYALWVSSWNMWNYFDNGRPVLQESPWITKAYLGFVPSTNQKFRRWKRNDNALFYRNWESIPLNSYTTGINGWYEESVDATIRNTLEGVTNLDAGTTVSFKDPWKRDDNSDPAKGIRNRGSSAVALPYDSPLSVQTSSSDWLGVLRNQEYNPQNQNELYYSAQALTTQQFNEKTAYFLNWSATGADVTSPSSLTTPVVFRQPNAIVNANYKGINLSGSTNALSNPGQHKIVRTYDGKLHKVYESMNKVWYETSTDNGITWQLANGGQPVSTQDAKNPSIDWDAANKICIVYQEKYNNNYYSIKFRTAGSNGILGSETEIYNSYNVEPYSSNANPSVGWALNQKMVFIWRQNDGIYYQLGFMSSSGFQWYMTFPAKITGTTITAQYPTITADKEVNNNNTFHAVWNYGSALKYCSLTASGYTIAQSAVETPSTGSLQSNNSKASIIIMTDGSIRLAWLGDNRMVMRSRQNGSWYGTFWKFGSNVASGNITRSADNNYIIAFSTSNHGNYYFKNSNFTNQFGFGISGDDIHVANGANINSLRAIVVDKQAQPYIFNFGSPVTSKTNNIASSSAREGIALKGDAELYYTFGDISVDDEVINFVELNEDENIESLQELHSYLVSEPFDLNSNSNFTFSVKYGVVDSLIAYNSLQQGENINFKVNLYDNQTNELLGTFADVTLDRDHLVTTKFISYNVETSNIGTREVKLALELETEMEVQYILGNLSSENGTIEKQNFESVKINDAALITDYALEQNYPNPFNPETTIKYQIPENGTVTLKVYDILGKEITTLVNDFQTKGRYEVRFDGGSLSSGVYIYTLNVNNFTDSKKFVLMK